MFFVKQISYRFALLHLCSSMVPLVPPYSWGKTASPEIKNDIKGKKHENSICSKLELNEIKQLELKKADLFIFNSLTKHILQQLRLSRFWNNLKFMWKSIFWRWPFGIIFYMCMYHRHLYHTLVLLVQHWDDRIEECLHHAVTYVAKWERKCLNFLRSLR